MKLLKEVLCVAPLHKAGARVRVQVTGQVYLPVYRQVNRQVYLPVYRMVYRQIKGALK